MTEKGITGTQEFFVRLIRANSRRGLVFFGGGSVDVSGVVSPYGGGNFSALQISDPKKVGICQGELVAIGADRDASPDNVTTVIAPYPRMAGVETLLDYTHRKNITASNKAFADLFQLATGSVAQIEAPDNMEVTDSGVNVYKLNCQPYGENRVSEAFSTKMTEIARHNNDLGSLRKESILVSFKRPNGDYENALLTDVVATKEGVVLVYCEVSFSLYSDNEDKKRAFQVLGNKVVPLDEMSVRAVLFQQDLDCFKEVTYSDYIASTLAIAGGIKLKKSQVNTGAIDAGELAKLKKGVLVYLKLINKWIQVERVENIASKTVLTYYSLGFMSDNTSEAKANLLYWLMNPEEYIFPATAVNQLIITDLPIGSVEVADKLDLAIRLAADSSIDSARKARKIVFERKKPESTGEPINLGTYMVDGKVLRADDLIVTIVKEHGDVLKSVVVLDSATSEDGAVHWTVCDIGAVIDCSGQTQTWSSLLLYIDGGLDLSQVPVFYVKETEVISCIARNVASHALIRFFEGDVTDKNV